MKNLIYTFFLAIPVIGFGQPNRILVTPQGSMIFETCQHKVLVEFKKEANAQSRKKWERNVELHPGIKNRIYNSNRHLIELDIANQAKLENVVRMIQSPDVASIRPFLFREGIYQAYHRDIMVRLKRPQDLKALQSDCLSLRMIIEMQNEFSPLIYHLKAIDEDADVFDLSNKMNDSGKYDCVMPDFIEIMTPAEPNDPLLPSQWAITRDLSIIPDATWGHAETHTDMQVLEAWEYTTGSEDIKIAVLDDGVQLDHPDLVENLLPGRDFTGHNTNGGPFNIYDNHGTSCAGIIAAVGNNGLGITGVAYTSRIIPVKIAVTREDGSWITSSSAKINAINWARQQAQADILSCSWGNSWNPFLEEAIDSAVLLGRDGRGCLFVFATGNQNLSNIPSNHWTASYSKTIGVGATNQCDQRKSGGDCGADGTWGSNFGEGISVAAPGTSILTTHYNPSGPVEFDYHEFDGTSAATPHVAGILALMLSTDYYLHWNYAKSILEKTCDKVGSYAYINRTNGLWCNELGYGRVNAVKALMTVAYDKIRPVGSIPESYCPSYNSRYNSLWIEQFELGDLHASGNDYGYGDHTKIHLTTRYGKNHFRISTNEVDMASTSWDWGFSFIRQFQLWIDFNGDRDFEDLGEMVFDTSTINSLADINGFFDIPFDAPPITTRMRVRLQYDAHSGFLYPLTPCQITGGMESEDYTIVISPDSMLIIPLCTAYGINNNEAWIEQVNMGNMISVTGNNHGHISVEKNENTFMMDRTYPINLTPGFKAKRKKQTWSVWMDLNRDGQFVIEEMLFEGKSKYTLSSTINIPAETYGGEVNMRIVMHPSTQDLQDICGPIPEGEVEDYTINLVEHMDYCAIEGNTSYEYIKAFSLNGDGFYLGDDGPYRNLVPTLTPFNLYHQNTIKLEPGFINHSYPEHWTAYIDLNADGKFEDSERIVSSNQPQIKPFEGQFFIDQYTLPGKSTMRIILSYSIFTETCGTVPYGDIVDVPVYIRLSGNQISLPEFSIPPAPGLQTNFNQLLTDSLASISIFPNPAKDWITIRNDILPESKEINILDINGQLMKKILLMNGINISVSIDDLTPGVYTVQMIGHSGAQSKKFIKM